MRSPQNIMVKVYDCGLEVSESEYQLYFHFHFRTNTIGEGMNHFILQL